MICCGGGKGLHLSNGSMNLLPELGPLDSTLHFLPLFPLSQGNFPGAVDSSCPEVVGAPRKGLAPGVEYTTVQCTCPLKSVFLIASFLFMGFSFPPS